MHSMVTRKSSLFWAYNLDFEIDRHVRCSIGAFDEFRIYTGPARSVPFITLG